MLAIGGNRSRSSSNIYGSDEAVLRDISSPFEGDLEHRDPAPSPDVIEPDVAMEDEQAGAHLNPGGYGDSSPARVDGARASVDPLGTEGEAIHVGTQGPLEPEVGSTDPEVQRSQHQDPGETHEGPPHEDDPGRGATDGDGGRAFRPLSRIPLLRGAYELFGLGHRRVSQQREPLPGTGSASTLGEGEQGHCSQLEDNLGLQRSRGDGKEGKSAQPKAGEKPPAKTKSKTAPRKKGRAATSDEDEDYSMISEAGDNHEKILDLEKTVMELKAQIDAAKRDSTGNR